MEFRSRTTVLDGPILLADQDRDVSSAPPPLQGCCRGGADGRPMLLLRPCSSCGRQLLRSEGGKWDARELAGDREGHPRSSANAPLPRCALRWPPPGSTPAPGEPREEGSRGERGGAGREWWSRLPERDRAPRRVREGEKLRAKIPRRPHAHSHPSCSSPRRSRLATASSDSASPSRQPEEGRAEEESPVVRAAAALGPGGRVRGRRRQRRGGVAREGERCGLGGDS
ncbi:unnamed protein product [Urochloa humidicola]